MRLLGKYLLAGVLTVVFSLSLFCLGFSQKSIAVDWNAPKNLLTFNKQLSSFKEHGVNYLIVNHPLSEAQINSLDEANITYLVNLNQKFISKNDFLSNSEKYIQVIEQAKSKYTSSSSFKAIIGFSHSNIELIDYEILERKKDGIFTLSAQQRKLFQYFDNTSLNPSSIIEFKKKLDTVTAILVVQSDWLNSAFVKYPEFEKAFLSGKRIDPSIIPLPKTPNQLPAIHWAIIVLLLLWISLAVNVATTPTYLEIIPRYFTAHRFFVDDIMSYRERSSRSSIFLLFQHAIFGGLVTYILAKVFVSTIGLEALYYYLPYIGIMGQNYFSLFVLSSIIIFIVELIALVWLYIPNKEMTHLNQALNLFTWIFHLDFILATVLITAYFAELSSIFISILAISYLLIWFSSFNITAFDASKRLGMARNAYLFKTIGLHTVVIGLIVALLISFNGWWNLLELIVSI